MLQLSLRQFWSKVREINSNKLTNINDHERRQGEQWIFKHNTANVFFNKYSLCENITTLTNHRSSLLCWLTFRGRGDWGQVGIWVHENGLKFSKKVGIFPKMLLQKGLHFYARLLMQRSFQVSPGCMPSAPPSPPLIK